MPLTPRVELLRVRRTRREALRWALWREWCFVRALGRRMGLRLAVLAALLFIGAILFRTIQPEAVRSFPQAVYFTFCLMLGEPPEDYPDSAVLQVLFFAVPILGLTVLVESMVEVADVLRDRQRNDRMWSETMVQSLSNHVILVGLGRVGFRSYRALHGLGVPVVVVDIDEKGEFLADVRRDGTPVLIGDARREATLAAAGVERARAIVAATNDDLANLEVALDARKKHPAIHVVLRMFDQNMADKVHDGFDIRASLSSAALSAPTFAAAAVVPHLVASSLLEDKLVLMVQHVIKAGDPWCGQTLAALAEAHRIAVVKRTAPGAAAALFPPPSTTLSAGDALVVQGVYEDLLALGIA